MVDVTIVVSTSDSVLDAGSKVDISSAEDHTVEVKTLVNVDETLELAISVVVAVTFRPPKVEVEVTVSVSVISGSSKVAVVTVMRSLGSTVENSVVVSASNVEVAVVVNTLRVEVAVVVVTVSLNPMSDASSTEEVAVVVSVSNVEMAVMVVVYSLSVPDTVEVTAVDAQVFVGLVTVEVKEAVMVDNV